MAKAIGAVVEDTRADFILHKRVDIADKNLNGFYEKANREAKGETTATE